MQEFISSEITYIILEQNHMIFGTVKEGILEILDERLSSFRSETMAFVGMRSLSFREFRACGASDYHGEKDPIGSRRWLVDVANVAPTVAPRGKWSYLLPIL